MNNEIEKNEYFDIPAERINKVMSYVERYGNAKISELALAIGVSESTIRRDLDALVNSGKIERTHGGAILPRRSLSFEHPYKEKMRILPENKKRIGEFCAKMVQDGDTVFLDSGTTIFRIGENLTQKKNLTIFTYDLFIASMLCFDVSTQVIVTGGVKREGHNVLTGSVTEDFISRIRFNTLFLGADAIDEHFGISNTILPEASIKTKLCRAANKVVLAADSTKFGKTAVAKVCDLNEVDCIVTDTGLRQNLFDVFSKHKPILYTI